MEHLLIAKSVERAKVAICKARHKRASGAVRCGAVVVVRLLWCAVKGVGVFAVRLWRKGGFWCFAA